MKNVNVTKWFYVRNFILIYLEFIIWGEVKGSASLAGNQNGGRSGMRIVFENVDSCAV